jgi:hypothetical protein
MKKFKVQGLKFKVKTVSPKILINLRGAIVWLAGPVSLIFLPKTENPLKAWVR